MPDLNPSPPPTVRIDKWLWAVRLYKTRTLAAQACRAGHVKIAGEPAKPAQPVRLGQIVTAQFGSFTRTIRVLDTIDRRVSAALAKLAAEDLTPPAEYAKREQELQNRMLLPHPATRPSKKDRRALEKLKEWFDRPLPEP